MNRSKISVAHSLTPEEINLLTAFQRVVLRSCHFNLFRMRAVFEFRSTGKGLFALRKTIKLSGDVELSLERDPDNLKGLE